MGQPTRPTQPSIPKIGKQVVFDVFTWITQVETLNNGRLWPRVAE